MTLYEDDEQDEERGFGDAPEGDDDAAEFDETTSPDELDDADAEEDEDEPL